MKKKILASLIILSINEAAQAEVPKPGTARKGPITVTPEGQKTSEYDLKTYKVIPRSDSRKVQRMVDGLRKRIRDLEAELAKPKEAFIPVVAAEPFAEPPVLTQAVVKDPALHNDEAETHRHRIALYGGIAPDGVHVDKNDLSRKASLHETGTAIGASYGYLLTDRWSFNAFGSVTTRSTYIPSGYAGIGYDF